MPVDSFTYADGNLVTVASGAWQAVDDPFVVSGNKVTFTPIGGNDSVAAWSTAITTADQYVEADVDLTSLTGTHSVGVALRIDVAAFTYMMATIDEFSGGRIVIQGRLNSGLYTGAYTPDSPYTLADGYVGVTAGRLKLEAVGNVYSVYWNGTLKYTVTDTTVSQTGRKVGITGYRETGAPLSYIDNWAGGIAGTSGTSGSVFIGAGAISNLKFGANQVSRLYVGSTIAWQFGGGPTPQTWTRSNATVTVAGTSGAWSVAAAPQTWTRSDATVTVTGTSGVWSVATSQTWTGSPATVSVAGTSGTWTGTGIAYKGSLGSNVATTSANNLVITTTAPIAVGDLVVVRVAADNLSSTTPTFTCADSSGNLYTTHAQGATGTAAAGVAGAIMCSFATTAVNTGGTITVQLSGSVAARAAFATSFAGADNVLRAAPTATAAGTTAAVSSGASSTAIIAGDLVLGWSAVEGNAATTGDADTTNGSWSTITSVINAAGGTANTRVQTNGQYKIATGSGAQTYDNTTTATDWVAGVIAMQPNSPLTWTGSAATTTVTGTSGTWSVASAGGGFTKYRTFNGTTDLLTFSLGNLSGASTNPCTFVAVVRKLSGLGADAELMHATDYDPLDWFYVGSDSSHTMSYYDGSSDSGVRLSWPSGTAATDWRLVAIRVPSGSTSQWSLSQYNGTAWPTPTHSSGGTTYGTKTFTAGKSLFVGGTPYMNVDIVCIARFNAALSDAQINGMTAGKAAIKATSGCTNCWEFDIATPADTVGTSALTATSGTTLSSTDSPFPA